MMLAVTFSRSAGCLLSVCLVTALGRVAHSQEGGAVEPGTEVTCRGQQIRRIEIETRPPFQLGGPKFARKIINLSTSLHMTTKASVVRRYLALRVGDACTELRRYESERILRAQPYLADAQVRAYAVGPNDVVLRVETVDEISALGSGTVGGGAPVIKGVRVGEANLGGLGVLAALSWRHSELFRDIYRAQVTHNQFLGRPYILSADATRADYGGSFDIQASHPFYTDLQRISWRATLGATTRLLYLHRGERPPAALPITRSYGDIGAVRTFGPPGKVFMAGLSFSRERESTGNEPVIVTDTGFVADTSEILMNRYGDRASNRVNLLLGYRRVDFLRVTGFDAVQGAQDVRRGFQVALAFGKGMKIKVDDERDYFNSVAAYYGGGDSMSFYAAEVIGERRKGAERWDGMLVGGRSAWYYRWQPNQTLVSSLEFSGGWRQRSPFQLTFADRQGGLPAYNKSEVGGARRLVLRVEDRYRAGKIRELVSTAYAGFVNVGKLWAGDAPFGVTTNPQLSVGVSVLAAFPPSSRRTWRMDLAMPLNDRKHNKFQVQFSNSDMTRWFWREPGDVQAGRERAIPNSVYNWP